MAGIKSLCVYCGSRRGAARGHIETASQLGTALAKAGIRMVYGGGSVGMMGLVADAAIGAGGSVAGVIPRHLHDAEVAHPGLDELIVVDSMHARKQRMFELSEAFVALPGGIGTLDETVEIVTWRQLGLHDKPIFLLDDGGYWQPFLELIEHFIAADFSPPSIRRLYEVVGDVGRLMAALERAPAPSLSPHPERL